MPRGRRARSKVSASDAYQFLQHLIREGKVLASDIGRYLEIRQLEERLAALNDGGIAGRALLRRKGRLSSAAPAAGRLSGRGRLSCPGRRRRRLCSRGLRDETSADSNEEYRGSGRATEVRSHERTST